MSSSKTLGLVGRKAGMTRVFTEAGETVPVTVIEALPNRVTQVRTPETDGYRGLQVAYGERKASHLNKALAGHYAKVKVAPGEGLVEFRLADDQGNDLQPGAELKVDFFSAGQIVDVTGTTTGKGFAGTMKRHNFGGLPATHGVSVSHRSPGSIGQRQTPGRVFPGKRMAGRMGNARRTIENLQVVRVDADRNLLLISGAVPGAPGGQVIVRPSVKAEAQKRRKKVAPSKINTGTSNK
ncbi:MAG: 50S ribosomal protein L3, partial [Steroidobacteraceae bacterium]